MHPVLIELTDGAFAQGKRGEKACYFLWLPEPPALSDTFQPVFRPWDFLYVQEYRSELRSLYVAIAHPAGLPIPDPENWATVELCSEPDIDYSMQIFCEPGGQQIQIEWTNEPEVPEGLFVPYNIAYRSLWQIEGVERFEAVPQAAAPRLYKTIHLAWCADKVRSN